MKILVLLMALFATTAGGLCSSERAVAGPFGINPDSNLDAMECSAYGPPHLFECKKVPKPHPYFTDYIVKQHPSAGVCYIHALGPEIENDAYGGSARMKADEIRDQLAIKYGPEYKAYTYLHPGTIWDAPQDWTMSIRKEERRYAYLWTAESGFRPVDGVVSVYVGVVGWGFGTAIKTEFEIENAAACEAAIANEAAGSF